MFRGLRGINVINRNGFSVCRRGVKQVNRKNKKIVQQTQPLLGKEKPLQDPSMLFFSHAEPVASKEIISLGVGSSIIAGSWFVYEGYQKCNEKRLIDEYFKSNMYYLASFPFLALGSKLAGVSPVAVPISVFATLIFSSFGHGIEYEEASLNMTKHIFWFGTQIAAGCFIGGLCLIVKRIFPSDIISASILSSLVSSSIISTTAAVSTEKSYKQYSGLVGAGIGASIGTAFGALFSRTRGIGIGIIFGINLLYSFCASKYIYYPYIVQNRKSRRDVLFNASKTMAIPFFGFYGLGGFILSLLSFIP